MRPGIVLWMTGPMALALAIHGCGTGSGGVGGGGDGGFGAGVGGGAAAGGDAGGGGGAAVGGSGATDGSAAGGGTGGTGAGGSGTGAGPGDGGLDDVQFRYDAPEHEASVCVDETATADPVPLDIYFMLDASTSMSAPTGSGASGDCNAAPPFTPSVNSRWCSAVNAIAGYISSAQAAGNRAAVQYFQAFGTNNCNGSGYNTPAVGLGDLVGSFTGHAQALVQQNPGGLNWAYPHSATPTEGALRGLAQFTAANQTPGRTIIGVLVTDGVPTSCSSSDSVLRGIAQNHFNATGIHTFMVGMTGASFTRLENWASYTGALIHDDTNDACGTCNGCNCHHYNVGNGSPAVFIAALNQIQQAALSCTFQVPTPAQGVLNPDAVKVEYYPGGQPPPQELTKVANAAACTGPGWYYGYDAQSKPITINMCPATCSVVQADTQAEIKIRIACQGS